MAKKIIIGLGITLVIGFVGFTIFNKVSDRDVLSDSEVDGLPPFVQNVMTSSDDTALYNQVVLDSDADLYLGVALINSNDEVVNFTIEVVNDAGYVIKSEDERIIELQDDTEKISRYVVENLKLPESGDVTLDALDYNVVVQAVEGLNIPEGMQIDEDSIKKYHS